MPHYEIIKRTKEDVNGIQMGSKTGKFKNGIIRTKDRAMADDIRQAFGQNRKDGRDADVLVAEVPDRTTGNKFAVSVSFDKDGNII